MKDACDCTSWAGAVGFSIFCLSVALVLVTLIVCLHRQKAL